MQRKVLGRIGAVSRTLLVLGALSFCAQALAQSSVWVATKDSQSVYLGGTVHLLRPSDYPLPTPFDTAYEASEQLYFETDIAGLSDMSVQARLLQELTYNDDRSLRTILDESTYQALTNHLGTIGMPIQMLEKFKPGLLVSTLQVFEFQKLGFTPQGVDAYFNTRAIGDAKALGELESIDAQISYIADMGVGNESEFIRLSLEEFDEMGASMEQMIDAWRSGDDELLDSLFVRDMKVEHPRLYDSLLVQRNLNWMPIIESMFGDSDTEFVLVGAAHLVGEDGLLNMLRNKGYQVRQLD
tara:strand:- start:105 stop:998 length:894 start_codon:yes stop_codon:yes gene_type:complete